MSNKVFLNEQGFVESTLEGEQSWETMYKTIGESFKHQHILSAQNKPINILVDVTSMTGLDRGSTEISKSGMGAQFFDKMAVYGAKSEKLKDMILEILKSGSDNLKTQYFDTREDAIKWLNS